MAVTSVTEVSMTFSDKRIFSVNNSNKNPFIL